MEDESNADSGVFATIERKTRLGIGLASTVPRATFQTSKLQPANLTLGPRRTFFYIICQHQFIYEASLRILIKWHNVGNDRSNGVSNAKSRWSWSFWRVTSFEFKAIVNVRCLLEQVQHRELIKYNKELTSMQV